MYHTSTVDIVQCNLFSEYDALIENHGIPLKSFHMLHVYYDIILLTVCQACKKNLPFMEFNAHKNIPSNNKK